jgi:hypothetical protein
MSLYDSMKRCNECGTVSFPDARRCPKCSSVYGSSALTLLDGAVKQDTIEDICSEIYNQINLAVIDTRNKLSSSNCATIDITARITIPLV